MAVAFVQEAHAQATGSFGALSATFGGSVNSGSTLVLCVATLQPVSSVSGCGATWTRKLTAAETGSTANCELWVGTGATSGTTVTVTPTSNTVFSFDVMEFSGVNSVGTGSSQVNGSSASAQTPSLTLASGDAGYSFVVVKTGVTISGQSDTPSSWTRGFTSTNGTLTTILEPAYITAITGSAQHAASLSGSSTSVGESILLSATGGGGGGGGSRPRRPVVAGRAVTRAAVI